MANPQKENGYTMIANELLEGLCRTRLSGESHQILDAILRKTYGFNKKTDMISLSQFCIMTGLTKSTVCRAIRTLKMRNIIKTRPLGYSTEYEINKDYESWGSVKTYDRIAIFERDQYMCHICHSVKDATELDVDHIIPLWMNGSNKDENLATCCRKCNRKKGSERLRYKTDTVTELPQLQKDKNRGDKIAKKPVTEMIHTKETTKDTIQKKEIARIPKQETETFFKGIQDLIIYESNKEIELTQEAIITQGFLKALNEKYPQAKKSLLWTEIKKFQSYWTELDQKGKQQRWQMQKTFEVSKRLTTWLMKIDSFKGSENKRSGNYSPETVY